jgi:cyclic pyranopterin phosphate synthase
MSGNTDDGQSYSTDAESLTHVDDSGDAQMVDVGSKADVERQATAEGTIILRPATVEAIRDDGIEKGDVLATARIGAIQAVKHTWETIPMCHQIPITNVETDFEVEENRVVLTVAVETTGKNVIWDMVKATEKDDDGQYPVARLEDVRVTDKQKG